MDTPMLIGQYKTELEEIVKEANQALLNLGSLSAKEKKEKIGVIKIRLQHGENVYKTLQLESRDLDLATRRQVQAEIKNLHSHLKRMQADITSLSDRSNLLGAKELETWKVERGGQQQSQQSTSELLKSAHSAQDESFESLERSKRIVEETEQVGIATTTQLGAQREQLINVSKNLDEVEDQLKRADQLIRSFGRRMATDKLILCFLFLIVTGVIFIIGYKIYQSQH
eukprot:c15269_g1_i1.p1 GENE.c15269_g1_i1~~c15269_g1_i1.p1  ORF type:complete len:227 (+),score=85.45 c15269_g1_i1:33-713(+)